MAKTTRAIRFDDDTWNRLGEIAAEYGDTAAGLITKCVLQVIRERDELGPPPVIRDTSTLK